MKTNFETAELKETSERPGGKMSRIVREFTRLAPVYDHRWADYVQATHERTLERLALSPRQRLLDVGCGTGAFLQTVAGRYAEVELTGVDICERMLETARRKLRGRAALVLGQAERLPLASEHFDAVVSCSSLHCWQRPKEGLREMARVLKPEGLIVITDWCHDYVRSRVLGLFLRVVRREFIQVFGCQGCKRLLETVGFASIQIERYRIGWLWGLMTGSGRLEKSHLPPDERRRALPAMVKYGELSTIDSQGDSKPFGV